MRVFRQTGWFIAGLMTGLPATAAPRRSIVNGRCGGRRRHHDPAGCDSHVTGHAVLSAGESAALERLDCYDRLLAPLSPSGFDGALVKAGFVGEAWTRATEQEKRREGNTTELLVTQVPGERPTV